jgi:hypothetical protein
MRLELLIIKTQHVCFLLRLFVGKWCTKSNRVIDLFISSQAKQTSNQKKKMSNDPSKSNNGWMSWIFNLFSQSSSSSDSSSSSSSRNSTTWMIIGGAIVTVTGFVYLSRRLSSTSRSSNPTSILIPALVPI